MRLSVVYVSENPNIQLIADKAKEALEPIFSLDDDVALQNFRSVFRTSLNDPALLNAVLFVTTFAVTENVLHHDCLSYQTQALTAVRERISLQDGTTTIPTLGAILLLAGVEVLFSRNSEMVLS